MGNAYAKELWKCACCDEYRSERTPKVWMPRPLVDGKSMEWDVAGSVCVPCANSIVLKLDLEKMKEIVRWNAQFALEPG